MSENYLDQLRQKFDSAAGGIGLVSLISASTIKPEPISWIWNGWIAAGKLHILAGAPGTGKTTVALSMAATISAGTLFPDGATSAASDVLIWSAEDDPTDTLVPRLIAMGADLNRILIIDNAFDSDGRRAFDPATDVPLLRATISAKGLSPKLLIVDPIVSAVAGDSHKGSETRRALQPLVDLGKDIGCAVLGISHFSKGTAGRDVVERVTGSLAFGALARLVYAAAKMPDDQGGGRFIARAKSNVGPDGGGYQYDLAQIRIPGDAGIDASAVVWGEPIKGTARDILAQAETTDDPETRTQTDEAEEWLTDLLSLGPVKSADAVKKARAAGISEKVLRGARKRLGVRPRKSAYSGGWTLSLPDPEGAQGAQDAQLSLSPSEGALGAFDADGRLGKPAKVSNGHHTEEF